MELKKKKSTEIYINETSVLIVMGAPVTCNVIPVVKIANRTSLVPYFHLSEWKRFLYKIWLSVWTEIGVHPVVLTFFLFNRENT